MISMKKIAEAPIADCPYTRQSKGIVRMPAQMIAQLAAAVADPDEWAIVLTGEIRERGYEVEVKDYFLPNQERSSGHVEVGEFDSLDLKVVDGVIQTAAGDVVVGVIHSHHHLGAFFSTTDETKLNPRFPVSIVIAQAKLQYLGFDYKGTGKVTLPCGSRAEVPFYIQSTEGPVLHEVHEVTHNEGDLGKCSKYEDRATDAYHVHYHAACGLVEPEQLKANAFGAEPALLELVKVLPRPQLTQQQWDASGSQSLVDTAGPTSLLCHKCKREWPTFKVWEQGKVIYKIWCSDCKVASVPAKKPAKVSAKKPDVLHPDPNNSGGWLSSLIPDRFKSHPRGDNFCRECLCDADFCVCVTETPDAPTDEVLNMYKCEVCGEYDPFDDWECGNCNDGVFCWTCQVGHAENFECRA